jgi:very-short-patch-repair endonuclease
MSSEPESARDRARRLRAESTEAERRLWAHLRAKRFLGFKFRRQHPIGPYFVDFCCVARRLVIEIDGSQHAEEERVDKDVLRTAYLNQQGYQVIRVWNNEVTKQIESVLDAVYAALTSS